MCALNTLGEILMESETEKAVTCGQIYYSYIYIYIEVISWVDLYIIFIHE